MILDGEMAITDPAGKTDFQALQNYLKNPQGKNLTYIVFDLLALDGADLRGRRLIDRKEMLEVLLMDTPQNLHYSRHVRGNGQESFRAACAAGLDGIIGKKADSVYSATRNGDWIKLKCEQRQEFVIGGYTLSTKKVSGISSLLLGVYDGEDFVYAGRAGTGLSEADIKELEGKFAGLKSMEPPFKPAPKPRSNEKITWLEPELVAEIKFAEWTAENLLRQASFKGLRKDKNPRDIKKEKAGEENVDEEIQPPSAAKGMGSIVEAKTDSLIIAGIKISNPDKVVFTDPEITKGDVIRYYEKVAERMLPYVSHRVLSIVRCPKGISETCFYKKHPGPGSKISFLRLE